MDKKQKILVVAAHPDDEVLGCGATIAKLKKQGSQIFCLILGRGKSSRYKTEKDTYKKEKAALKKEAEKAGKILGISKMFFEDFPDQKYETVPLIEIIKSVEKIKNQIKPDVVFTHHSGDLNLDHQITFKAVITAFRPLKGESAKEIFSFEVLSSTEWSLPKRKNYFVPNVFVDASQTLQKKLGAMASYKSELKKYPHPRSSEGIKILAQKRGMEAGLKFAEAFELIRLIK